MEAQPLLRPTGRLVRSPRCCAKPVPRSSRRSRLGAAQPDHGPRGAPEPSLRRPCDCVENEVSARNRTGRQATNSANCGTPPHRSPQGGSPELPVMVRHICLVVLYPFGSDQAAPPTCGDSSSDGTTQPPTVGSFSTWRYFTSLFRWYLPSDPTIVMTAPAITASVWTLSQRFFLVYAITGPGHGRHATGDRELLWSCS